MTPYPPDELRAFLSPLSFDGPIGPFLVLADWLQERNDPWGALIAVEAALEAASTKALEDERAAILAKHGTTICPLHRWTGARLVYRRGFIASATLGDAAGADANEIAARLTALLSSPAATLVERLDASESHFADPQAKALIAEKERLARVRIDLRGNLFSASAVEELKTALPNADLSNQKVAPRTYEPYFAESGSEHRAFIRLHGGPRSIEDIDD